MHRLETNQQTGCGGRRGNVEPNVMCDLEYHIYQQEVYIYLKGVIPH